MTRSKPLFAYAGGKTKLLKLYYPFFQGLRPEHCVDYFGGSGGMTAWFHHLYPEAKLYLNEVDPALYKLFKCIQEEYAEFRECLEYIEGTNSRWDGVAVKKELYNLIRNGHNNIYYWRYMSEGRTEEEARDAEADMLMEHFGISRQDIAQFKEDFAGCGVETAQEFEEESGMHTPWEHANYLFLRRMGFSGVNHRNRRGKYTTAAGIRSATQPCYNPEVLADFKAMLDHAELFNTDYRTLDFHLPKSLHYFDPPYLNSAKKLYTSRFGWDETAELCEYVQRLAEHSTVFMSNYDDPRLKKLLKGFQWSTFPPAGGMQRKRKKDPAREILFYKIHPSIVG